MEQLNKKVKVIAFYLPQFHPIPENDEWWGKGFTEWTSVGKAKKYFFGHYQPRVPADLGYYDLRLPQVRELQADLAKEAGISAFCYWHYWFGGGKHFLEQPLPDVVRLGNPDFPFCLGWANHTWLNKSWNREKQLLLTKPLILQTYPGKEDVDKHFYTMLPMFQDPRYFRIHGKLLFLIYSPFDIPDFKYFRDRWNELADLNNLPGFYFIANSEDISNINRSIIQDFDAVSLCRLYSSWNIEGNKMNGLMMRITRNISRILGYSLNVISYRKAIETMDTECYEINNVYPNIIPCWDNSPRRGPGAYIFHNSTPDLFKKHVRSVLNRIKNKPDEDKVIFLKSWNEWAEGNYLEPDLKWGKGYIKSLNEILTEFENTNN